MENNASSYRPHNPGHDYYAPGIYLITLVVRDRSRESTLFGHLNDDPKSPAVNLSSVGEAVMACWESIPRYQAAKGRKVRVHRAVCMPDHFHGVIEVLERMDKSLGEVIRGFKAGCTKEWRRLSGSDCPNMANQGAPSSPCLSQAQASPSCLSLAQASPSCSWVQPSSPCLSQPYLDESLSSYADRDAEREMLQHISKKKRAEYYASHPSASQPLWDDNYDDTICLSDPSSGAYDPRHFSAMLRYVDDNPRRAIMRCLHPEFMSRRLHLVIKTKVPDGTIICREYAAFGNLFLLRWSRKIQVFCHRKARMHHLTDAERARYAYTGTYAPDFVTRVPYEQTVAFRSDCHLWKTQLMAGATVLVTPGISMGERTIKDRCVESRYPLIHLQKEPIGRYWKPELSRFDACISGSLLILAPWRPDELGEVNGVPSSTDFSIFHNLNQLAKEIVDLDIYDSTVSF